MGRVVASLRDGGARRTPGRPVRASAQDSSQIQQAAGDAAAANRVASRKRHTQAKGAVPSHALTSLHHPPPLTLSSGTRGARPSDRSRCSAASRWSTGATQTPRPARQPSPGTSRALRGLLRGPPTRLGPASVPPPPPPPRCSRWPGRARARKPGPRTAGPAGRSSCPSQSRHPAPQHPGQRSPPASFVFEPAAKQDFPEGAQADSLNTRSQPPSGRGWACGRARGQVGGRRSAGGRRRWAGGGGTRGRLPVVGDANTAAPFSPMVKMIFLSYKLRLSRIR